MKTRTVGRRTQLNRLARKIGRVTAQTEMTALEAKGELEARVRDLRARQEKALKRLTDLHGASHRALKEFKVGMQRAAAELDRAIRSATRQFRLPKAVKGISATTRGRRRRH